MVGWFHNEKLAQVRSDAIRGLHDGDAERCRALDGSLSVPVLHTTSTGRVPAGARTQAARRCTCRRSPEVDLPLKPEIPAVPEFHFPEPEAKP